MASKGWFVTILPIICLRDKNYLFKKLKHFFKALPLCYEMVESENIFCGFLIDYHNAAPIVHGVQMNNELVLIWKFHQFFFHIWILNPFFSLPHFSPFNSRPDKINMCLQASLCTQKWAIILWKSLGPGIKKPTHNWDNLRVRYKIRINILVFECWDHDDFGAEKFPAFVPMDADVIPHTSGKVYH